MYWKKRAEERLSGRRFDERKRFGEEGDGKERSREEYGRKRHGKRAWGRKKHDRRKRGRKKQDRSKRLKTLLFQNQLWSKYKLCNNNSHQEEICWKKFSKKHLFELK